MPDASPIKWHLAHTTWFFETFILKLDDAYESFDPEFEFLFNSYYNTVGEQFDRPYRGMLTRPTLQRVLDYRCHVDNAIERLFANSSPADSWLETFTIGLNHEQQHQELMLTDIKHLLSLNPLLPAYAVSADENLLVASPIQGDDIAKTWCDFAGGVVEVGYMGDGFRFDNEQPRHRTFVPDFSLHSSRVTNSEFLDFVQDGGYSRPELWLSMGWNAVKTGDWLSPLYWHQRDGQWQEFSLAGLGRLQPDAPVCHVSYFEADAFARWRGFRLPTEFEWETAANSMAIEGGVWQWTSSSYAPYPGYRPAADAIGEYNGKFMCNQYVLRGGSCATPPGHCRPTYRNFFPPESRWQFSGIRLAKDGN